MSFAAIGRPVRLAFVAILAVLSLVAAKPMMMLALSALVAALILPSLIDDQTGEERAQGFRIVPALLISALVVWAAVLNWEQVIGGGSSEAETAVASLLRDPGSAQFRDVKVGANAVCGEVNGKNAFGAYAGYRKFVYENSTAFLEPEKPAIFNVSTQTDYYSEVADFARRSQNCYS